MRLTVLPTHRSDAAGSIALAEQREKAPVAGSILLQLEHSTGARQDRAGIEQATVGTAGS